MEKLSRREKTMMVAYTFLGLLTVLDRHENYWTLLLDIIRQAEGRSGSIPKGGGVGIVTTCK